jgi:hypothetical protein
MQILGLVAALLIIFAFSNKQLFEKHKSFAKINKSYSSHMIASRDLQNKSEKKYFDLQKEEKAKKETKPSSIEQAKKEKKIVASKNCDNCYNQINLYPLIEEGKENHPQLYLLASNLIKILYGNSLFYKEANIKNLNQKILNSIITSSQKILKADASSEIFLEKLFFADSSLQGYFYKMLKGSNRSYPAFLENFVVDNSGKKAIKICLFHAKKDLLTSIFNEKMALMIIEKRKDKTEPFTQAELEIISKRSKFLVKDSNIWELISLNHKSQKPNQILLTGQDPKTKISMKRKFNFLK